MKLVNELFAFLLTWKLSIQLNQLNLFMWKIEFQSWFTHVWICPNIIKLAWCPHCRDEIGYKLKRKGFIKLAKEMKRKVKA